MVEKMFCFQCQETAMNKGCTKVGICGKQPKTANLQDKLIYVTKLFAKVLKDARNNGTFIEEEYENQINTNLFITITNAKIIYPHNFIVDSVIPAPLISILSSIVKIFPNIKFCVPSIVTIATPIIINKTFLVNFFTNRLSFSI